MKHFLAKALFAMACCLGILSTAFAQTYHQSDTRQGYIPFPPSMAATPPNCPGSKHWVTLGTGIAHCVLDDFVCPMAQHLVHDAIGNPSCVSNTCPSNQVLQGDGVSCACPAALSVWNGSSCVAPAPPPALSVTATQNGAPVAVSIGMLIASKDSEGLFPSISGTQFVITNSGGGVLSIYGVTPAMWAAVAGNGCAGANLGPSQSCTFTVSSSWASGTGTFWPPLTISVSTNVTNWSINGYAYYRNIDGRG